MSHEILRDEGASKGRYFLDDGGEPPAELTFSRAGERLIILDHTDVPDRLRGQRVGARLVLRAVEDARAEGRKVLPLCPFAAAEFRKHPEYQDVLG